MNRLAEHPRHPVVSRIVLIVVMAMTDGPPNLVQAHRKAWALAARVVFAISPNSASCERVFALLKRLFGEQQMRSLADLVQAALMLNYNKRSVG